MNRVLSGTMIKLVSLFFFFLAPCAEARQEASAVERETQQVLTAMQQQYKKTASFTADFEQLLTTAASGETQKRTGRLVYQRPDMLRFEIDSPERELLVMNEQYVWNYFAEEEAAYKYSKEAVFSSSIMLDFLSGKAALETDFWITHQEGDHQLITLELVPKKPDVTMTQAFIWLSRPDFVLTGIKFIDFYGNTNEVRLHRIVAGSRVSSSLFTFTPPEGSMVFDETQKKTGQ